MQKKSKIFKIFIFLITAVMLFSSLTLTPAISVHAVSSDDEVEYTNVLEDFQNDENFNIENYPTVEDDYSLEVIQIAESEDKELFIYVYQPCAETLFLEATSINISTNADNPNYKNYTLKFLNSNSTLQKYKVNNFTVSDEETRYYDISSILRAWNEDIDDSAGGDNTISEVAFEVGKMWTVTIVNGKTSYSCLETEVINVTEKFVGYVRYPDGYNPFYDKACDSHFVAFSTDKNIDRLYEAEVYFTSQERRFYQKIVGFPEINENPTFGDVIENYVKLSYTDKTSYEGGGLFAHKYEWNRIQTVSEFINSVNSSDTYDCGIINVTHENKINVNETTNLLNKQFVLRFKETDYTYREGITNTGFGQVMYSYTKNTIVGDVMILRLKFETDGIVYNLGVVDNKQTGDLEPINDEIWIINLPTWVKIILLILAIVLIILILYMLYPVLKILINIISFIVTGIINFFKWLFGLGKNKARQD